MTNDDQDIEAKKFEDQITSDVGHEEINIDMDTLDVHSELDFEDDYDEDDEEYTKTAFPLPSPTVSCTKGLPSFMLRKRLESFTRRRQSSCGDEDEDDDEEDGKSLSRSSSSLLWKDIRFSARSPRPSSPHPSLIDDYLKNSAAKERRKRKEKMSIKRSASVSLDKPTERNDSRDIR